jgi:hypothetical protein
MTIEVRLTVAGMLLLATSLILKRLLPVTPEGEAFNWIWRLHWACWLIGGGCVLYGVARIFALKDE